MNYKNGYKVVYEVAANGERTFYAAKSNNYPARDEVGNITDTKLASFADAEYAGKTIYEHAGAFYAADTHVAKLDKDGNPVGTKLAGFDALFVEDAVAPASVEPDVTEPETTEPEVVEPDTTAPEVEEEEEPEAGETEVDE